MQPFENFQKLFFKQHSPKSKLCCLFCSFKAGTDKMGPSLPLGMRKIFETSIMSSVDTSNLKHRCAKYIDQKISIFLNIDISKKKSN
jgi:hypothetical protein